MSEAYDNGSFKNLIVWQKSLILVRQIYLLTSKFPADEKFGIISQMRRAAVSIPSNIAEGHARRTTRDFIRFVSNSEGSLAELDTQLTISIDLNFCDINSAEQSIALMVEVRKMLNALRRSLSQKLD